MGSHFGDITAGKDENTVGVADGRQTVCDDKAGSVLHQTHHGFLNLNLGTGVDVGGCFV